jgi:peptidoglycan/xylan/chitin deacetylase (PgdA/CDA1 family)
MAGLICLSFDVEEWDSPVIYGVDSEYAMSDEFSAKGCRLLMDLLEKHGAKATFFTTGVFARNYPGTVKELAARGHEVGCHGNRHVILSRLPLEELKAEIREGMESVSKAAGSRVSGFRSPRNMINARLYEALAELKFEYDSSVHPAVLPGRLADVMQEKKPHKIGQVVEVPISTLLGLPISWWWMRNIGLWYTALGCKVSLMMHGYALLYFHPWEFTTMPEVKGLPAHITNRTGPEALSDIDRLISSFKRRGCEFCTVSRLIEAKRLND